MLFIAADSQFHTLTVPFIPHALLTGYKAVKYKQIKILPPGIQFLLAPNRPRHCQIPIQFFANLP